MEPPELNLLQNFQFSLSVENLNEGHVQGESLKFYSQVWPVLMHHYYPEEP